jgi:hypothetical protein
MNHQKLSFHAGERHSLEKLYQWILRQQEGGSRVATVDVLNYLQHELDYGVEEPSMSPRAPPGQQPAMPFTSSGLLVSSGSSAGQGIRSEHCDQQPKNTVFSNALSSPIRRSLQNYHISQGGSYYPNGNGGPPPAGAQNNESNFVQQQQNRDPSSNDYSMDMHAESPSHESN